MERIHEILLFVTSFLLIFASAAFTYLAVRLHTLEAAIAFSIKDVLELLDSLEKMDSIEGAEQYLAKLANLTPEQAKTEIQKGRMLTLIACRAAEIKAAFKTCMPQTYELIIKKRNGGDK